MTDKVFTIQEVSGAVDSVLAKLKIETTGLKDLLSAEIESELLHEVEEGEEISEGHLDLVLIQHPHSKSMITARQYFKLMLSTLWSEGEGFSGKRPFGNSGWEWDLYPGLIRLKLVEGVLDSSGYVEKVDEARANQLVFDLIGFL